MLKKISDYIPITSSAGIFSSFENPVWAVALPDAAELDTYFCLRYGDRIANGKMDYFADSDGLITGTKLTALSKMIYDINGNRWKHLFNAYMVEYNPIENTDYIETFKEITGNTKVIDSETGNTRTVDTDTSNTNVVDGETANNRVMDGDITNTKTLNTSKVTDGETTSGGTASTTSSGTSSGTDSNTNNVYGFNSGSAVGHDTSSGSNSGQTSGTSSTTTSASTTEDVTLTETGTVTDKAIDVSEIHDTATEDVTTTDTGTEDSTITDAGTEDSTITDNGSRDYELRKHGNIGVTTNTAMLKDHVDFWWKWSFVDYICQDICDFIALSIY